MKGVGILINGNQPNGRFAQGIISGSGLAPGMLLEMVPATEPVNGIWTYRQYQTGTNGDRRPVIVLLDDSEQGVTPDVNGANTYTSGTICKIYFPINGDELNLMFKNIAGTGDTHAIGDLAMIDTASGKLITQSIAANFAPFQVEETLTPGPTADTLLAVKAVF